MPLRACPDCSTEISSAAAVCPKCGHPFWVPRLLRLAFFISGLAICASGGLILYFLSLPPVGLGLFTHWQRGELTSLWLDLRLVGFGIIALGIVVLLIGYLWLRRFDSRQ